MPQIGQLPGSWLRTCGCIEQVHTSTADSLPASAVVRCGARSLKRTFPSHIPIIRMRMSGVSRRIVGGSVFQRSVMSQIGRASCRERGEDRVGSGAGGDEEEE